MEKSGNLYADLSGYYDRFCAEVNYAEQCDFADRAFACFADSDGKDYLDLACGTGQHLQRMAEKAYAVSGLDNSQSMLDGAARRCPSATLVLADLAGFDFHQRFDLITCFLYSLHYSHPIRAFTETLRRAFAALKPGGMLLFDMVDKNGVGQRDIVTHLNDDGVEFSFQSGWRYAGHGEDLDLNVAIRRRDAQGEQDWTDHHTMTAVSIAEVHAMMTNLGFEVTVLERDFSRLGVWNGKSFNALMVGKRPQ